MDAVEHITIVMDLPPPELHQNYRRGGHWTRKRDAVEKYRDAARKLCLERPIPASCPWPHARLSAAFMFPVDHRERDTLNYLAALKAAVDGFVDAGVIVSDDWRHLRIGEPYPEEGPMPRVTIMVERIIDDPKMQAMVDALDERRAATRTGKAVADSRRRGAVGPRHPVL